LDKDVHVINKSECHLDVQVIDEHWIADIPIEVVGGLISTK